MRFTPNEKIKKSRVHVFSRQNSHIDLRTSELEEKLVHDQMDDENLSPEA